MDRIVQKEQLDELTATDPRATRSRRDIQRLNLISGHHRIMARALQSPLQRNTSTRIVELGAGNGHFFLSLARRLNLHSQKMDALLVDRVDGFDPEVCAGLKKLGWNASIEIASAMDWLRQHSQRKPETILEIVVSNQFLHQFEAAELAEMFRLASSFAYVLIAVEPRRNFFPLLCSRLVGLVGCGSVTRYDAPVSVRAGFDGRELSALWPDENNWELTERRGGLFSHLFVAKRKS